jgi:UDP-sugar transporter A1/2/3
MVKRMSVRTPSHSAEATSLELPSQRPLRTTSLDSNEKKPRGIMASLGCCGAMMNGTKLMVLMILCLQNSVFTVLRRYSQGILKEDYSKHEVLLVGEVIKMVFSAYMISGILPNGDTLSIRLRYLTKKSWKMLFLALLYGCMNILSYISLRNIGAGMFTIFAQCKILTTASFSTIVLGRQYSWAQWRALIALMFGVLLFSEPIWSNPDSWKVSSDVSSEESNVFIGTMAVIIEVTLSGFASIYFEKVIKTDAEQLGIWERNFQLAFGSFPIYLAFMIYDGGSKAGYAGGWSPVAWVLALLGAAGGLLVALSIKYGDSILKTLATTGAICLSSLLDHVWLGGPLTPVMVIAGFQVIIAICNYTFDTTPVEIKPEHGMELSSSVSNGKANDENNQEEEPLVQRQSSKHSV